jgi:hypothetical protein
MAKEFPELPPSLEDIDDSAQPNENDATRSDYEGWWGRAQELYAYIQKVPSSLTKRVNMTDSKNKLIYEFDQLISPEKLSDVQEGDVSRLKKWINHAEGFVGFLLQSYEPSAPTTQVPVLVKDVNVEEDWHWPWIDGWDNPKKRKRILNPSNKDDNQVKRLLIGGAVIGGAYYIGKRFMGAD